METFGLNWNILLIIVGSAVVTFIPRVLPLMVLSRFDLPEWSKRWLHYVPVSVMAALAGQEVFMQDGELSVFTHPADPLAAVITCLVAVKTRSLMSAVVAGIGSIMLLRWLLQ